MNRTYDKRLPRALLLFTLLSIPFASYGQDNAKPKRTAQARQNQNLSPEERVALFQKQIEEIVEKYTAEMGDNSPNDEQTVPFAKAIAQSHLEQMKLMVEMRKLRKGKKGQPNKDQMLALQKKGQEIESQLMANMKELLDKKQFKAFKKAKEKLQPKRQKPQGGGRGAGGGGGGRGAGGGGGGPN